MAGTEMKNLAFSAMLISIFFIPLKSYSQCGCPGNITVSADPGQCSAVVNYAAPSDELATRDTMSFDSLVANISSYPEGGFVLASSGLLKLSSPNAVFSGSLNDHLTFSRADNKPFDLLSIDIRQLNASVGSISNIFTGHLASGGTVSDTIITDTTFGYKTFTFPATFRCLTSVTWNQALLVYDNLVTESFQTSNFVAGLGSGAAFPVGVSTEQYTIADTSGGNTNCIFSVTVNDNEKPVITCPNNITTGTDSGQCEAVVTFSDATATDNCTTPSISQTGGQASGSSFPQGVSAVTFTADDGNGNTATCSFNITVNENEPPVITCPNNITSGTDQGLCEAVVTFSDATATDNCTTTVVSQTGGQASGSSFQRGVSTVTFTATDDNGNTATCSFNITVNDDEPPAMLCPNNITTNTETGLCGATVTFNDPTTTENCPEQQTFNYTSAIQNWVVPAGITSLTIEAWGAQGGDVGDGGNYPLANGGKGARMKGDFLVTPGDTLKVLVGRQGPTNGTSSSGGGGSFVATATNTPLLIAGGGGGAWNQYQGAAYNGGDGLTTGSGGSNTGAGGGTSGNGGGSANFYGGGGGGFLTDGGGSFFGNGGQAFVNGGAGGDGGNQGGQAGGFGGGGSHTNNGSSIAGGGGGYSGGAGGGVGDGGSIPSGSSGGGGSFNSGTSQSNEAGVHSGDGLVIITYHSEITQTAGLPSGSFFPVGITVNTFMTSDIFGNTATCSFNVTVLDTSGDCTPFCPAGSYADAGSPTGCSLCPPGYYQPNPGASSCIPCPAGTYIDTAGATQCIICLSDTSGTVGNTTCGPLNPCDTSTLTITGMVALDPICHDVSNGYIYITSVSGGTPPYQYSIDTGATFQSYYGFENLSAGAYYIIVQDTNGCQTDTTITINNPSAVTVDVVVTDDTCGNGNGAIVLTGGGGSGGVYNYSIDNGGSFDTSGTFTGLSAGTYDIVVGNGPCYAITQATVNNLDTIPPTVVYCPDDTTVFTDPGQCTIAFVNNAQPVFSDNCSTPNLEVPIFGALGVGTKSLTFKATDGSGNTSTCRYSIIVEDNEPPVTICQNITVQLDSNGLASITPHDVNNDSHDNCGIDSLWLNNSAFDCADAATFITAENMPSQNDGAYAGSGHWQSFTATQSGVLGIVEVNLEILPGQSAVMKIYEGEGTGGAFLDSQVVHPTIPATAFFKNIPVAAGQQYTIEILGNANGWRVVSGNPYPGGMASTGSSLDFKFRVLLRDSLSSILYASSNGYLDSCSANITVCDTIKPEALCKNIQVLISPDSDSANIDDINDGSFDNCGSLFTGIFPNVVYCFYPSTLTATLTVVDAFGNESSCTATVDITLASCDDNDCSTYDYRDVDLCTCVHEPDALGCDSCANDTIPPVAVCPEETFNTYLDSSGSATVNAWDFAVYSTDNCSIDSAWLSKTVFTCADIPIDSITLYLMDAAGNVGECTGLIFIADTIAPTVTCKDTTVYLDASGSVSFDAAELILTFADNCSAETTNELFTATCGDLGTQSFTFHAGPESGVTSPCTSNITVLDTFPPVITCPGDISGCDSVINYEVSYSDGCFSDTLLWVDFESSYPFYESFYVQVDSLCPIDNNGLRFFPISGGQFTYTINASYFVGFSGNISYDLKPGDGSGSCETPDAASDYFKFQYKESSLAGSWTTLDSFTIADVSSQTHISYPIPLELIGKNVLFGLETFGSGNDNDVWVFDNFLITQEAPLQQIAGLPSGSVFPAGVTTNTFVGTDLAGNSDTCSFTVTVNCVDPCDNDTTPPIAVCQDITVQLDSNGTASITPQDVDGGSTDNCGIDSMWIDLSQFNCSFVIPPFGRPVGNFVTLTVADSNGNTAACLSSITVEDNIKPTAICKDITVYLDANGQGSFFTRDLDDGSTDNCSVFIEDDTIDVNCNNLGVTSAQLIVSQLSFDVANEGDLSVCESNVTILDTILPTVTCPHDTVLECPYSADTSLTGVATATDNCDVTTISFSDDTLYNVSCPIIATIERTWIATDASGNTSSCVQNISIEDNIPDHVPTDIVLQCTGNLTALHQAWRDTLSGAHNNECGGWYIVVFDSSIDFGCTEGLLSWSYDVVYFNACNQIPGTISFSIVDTIPPNVGCPHDTTINAGAPRDPGSLGFASCVDGCSSKPAAYEDSVVLSGCDTIIYRKWICKDDCGFNGDPGNHTSICKQVITISVNCDPCANINCDDGNSCTIDTCNNGICIHTQRHCNDNNPCTIDACDVNTVQCLHTAVICDDHNPCTFDACNPQTGCTYTLLSAAQLDDNNACTVDACSVVNGITHTPINCDDNDPCTLDACDPIAGCTHSPANGVTSFMLVNSQSNTDIRLLNSSDTVKLSCNPKINIVALTCGNVESVRFKLNSNNNFRTENEVPYTLTGDAPPGDYYDWNPAPGLYTITATPYSGNGASGTAGTPKTISLLVLGTNVPCAPQCTSAADCNDNVACTIDACNAGTCAHTPKVCNDNNPCTTDACDGQTGQCVFTPINCDDNNACTQDFCDIQTGQCAHTPISCNDNNPCTIDNCNPQTGCVFTPGECCSDTDCNDNVACTIDACNAGLCAHTLKDCDDNNACTIDNCDGNTGQCLHAQINCDDGNPCTSDLCDPINGCTHTVTNPNCCLSGADCDDNDPCTEDLCDAGICIHVADTSSSGPSYLRVLNYGRSWKKLKLGYSSSSLWYPNQNVAAGGNNQMCVTLRTVGTPEWNKILIRPQGSGSSAVTLNNYVSGAINDWTTICIPFSDFSGFNFSQITLIEIPYSNGAGAFEIHIQKIEFTGGSSPFLWFGDPKTDNENDGQSGSGSALYVELVQGSPCNRAVPKWSGGDETTTQQLVDKHEPFLNAYPNPFKDKVTIEFSLEQSQRVRLELVGIDGRKITTLFEGTVEGNELHSIDFQSGTLAEGMYFYRLITENGEIQNRKLMMVR